MEDPQEDLPEGDEPFPPGWRIMATVRWGILGLAAAAALFSMTYGAVSWMKRRAVNASSASPSSQARQTSKFSCPMHPDVQSKTAGNCPVCNMALVQIAIRSGEGSEVQGLHGIDISPENLRALDVRTEIAKEELLQDELHLVGRVAADPTRIWRVHVRTGGFVEELHATLGQRVHKGQPLFAISSDELTKLQQELVRAKQWGPTVLEPLRERLHLLGLGPIQMARIEAKAAVDPFVTISSPGDGFLTAVGMTRGDRVEPTNDLMEISDLSSVWVLADVSEAPLARVKVGTPGELRFFNDGMAQVFSGTVANVSPTVNAVSRAASVRLLIKNLARSLRPGTFGDVTLRLGSIQSVTVPEGAVMNTGSQRYVLVADGKGRFQPRAIQTGISARGRMAIRSGLRAGESVASDGHFFLDAESRLRGLQDLKLPEPAP